MPRQKASKGTVTVRSNDGRLYLRWSWSIELGGNGKRYDIATGLPDTKANRSAAELQARLIERDLTNRFFDPTLRKYRGDRSKSRLAINDMFEKFIVVKTPHLYKSSLIKYRALLKDLNGFFKSKAAEEITETEVVGFRAWLSDTRGLAPVTVKISSIWRHRRGIGRSRMHCCQPTIATPGANWRLPKRCHPSNVRSPLASKKCGRSLWDFALTQNIPSTWILWNFCWALVVARARRWRCAGNI